MRLIIDELEINRAIHEYLRDRGFVLKDGKIYMRYRMEGGRTTYWAETELAVPEKKTSDGGPYR